MAPLLLLLTAAVTLAAIAVATWAFLTDRRPRGRVALAGLGAWWGAYTAAVVVVSLTSGERRLAPGDTKRLCGFYLDCHRMITLVETRVVPEIRTDAEVLAAQGMYHVVTLRISSDARRAPMRIGTLETVVTDRSGRRFTRVPEAERMVAAVAPVQPLDVVLGPGESFTTTLVYDLPRDAEEPRLVVGDGDWLTKLSELFLIGDDDSLLHAPAAFRLAQGG